MLVLLLFCAPVILLHFLNLLPADTPVPKHWRWSEDLTDQGYLLKRRTVMGVSGREASSNSTFTPRVAFLLGHSFSINQADFNELQMLPGIGPKLAQRIINYRNLNGPLRSSRTLLLIRGIGPVMQKRLAPLLRFDDPEG